MITAVLIDRVIAYTDNVGALDGANATRRLRYLQYAQDVFDEVWNYRDWPFKYVDDKVTVTASTGEVDLPADFHEFGNQGGVYIDSTGAMLHESSPQSINARRETGESVTHPGEFAVYGFNATTLRKTLQVITVGGSTVLQLWYTKVSPTLVDDDAETPSLLSQIPVSYHHTVLLAGVIARSRKNKGDSRDWQAEFQRGLAYMTARERPKRTTTQYLPMATGKW